MIGGVVDPLETRRFPTRYHAKLGSSRPSVSNVGLHMEIHQKIISSRPAY